MPTNVKPETTSTPFSPEEIAAALAAASEPDDADDPIDWQQGILTPGGGVDATLRALLRADKPAGTAVTLRYSPEVLTYFKATGKGWRNRMDAALKEWIATQRR